jgi:hypothetical protein
MDRHTILGRRPASIAMKSGTCEPIIHQLKQDIATRRIPRQKISRGQSKRAAGFQLASLLLIGAIVALTGASLLWKRIGLTPVSAGRTF